MVREVERDAMVSAKVEALYLTKPHAYLSNCRL